MYRGNSLYFFKLCSCNWVLASIKGSDEFSESEITYGAKDVEYLIELYYNQTVTVIQHGLGSIIEWNSLIIMSFDIS